MCHFFGLSYLVAIPEKYANLVFSLSYKTLHSADFICGLSGVFFGWWFWFGLVWVGFSLWSFWQFASLSIWMEILCSYLINLSYVFAQDCSSFSKKAQAGVSLSEVTMSKSLRLAPHWMKQFYKWVIMISCLCFQLFFSISQFIRAILFLHSILYRTAEASDPLGKISWECESSLI